MKSNSRGRARSKTTAPSRRTAARGANRPKRRTGNGTASRAVAEGGRSTTEENRAAPARGKREQRANATSSPHTTKRSTRTAKKKQPAAKGRSRQGGDSAGVFSALASRAGRAGQHGLGTYIAVAEALGNGHDIQVARSEAFGASPGPGAAARKFASKARLDELARVLSAFGSPHRLQILLALLYGPATYRTLQRAAKLKAGPFYHHINQLRLAGFLGPKTRDVYVLTRAGRNALLVALSLAPLLKDKRARPLAVDTDEGS